MSERVSKRVCLEAGKREPASVTSLETGIEHLPTDVIKYVIGAFLGHRDILAASSVSHTWYAQFRPLVWERGTMCLGLWRGSRTSYPGGFLPDYMTGPDFKFHHVCCVDRENLRRFQGIMSPSVKSLAVINSSRCEYPVPDVETLVFERPSCPYLGTETRRLKHLTISGAALSAVAQESVALAVRCPELRSLEIKGTLGKVDGTGRRRVQWSEHGLINLMGLGSSLLGGWFFGAGLTRLIVPHCCVSELTLGKIPNLTDLGCAVDPNLTDADATKIAWPLGLETLQLYPVMIPLNDLTTDKAVTANLATPRYQKLEKLRTVIMSMQYLGNIVDLCLDSVTSLELVDQFGPCEIPLTGLAIGNAHASADFTSVRGLLDFTRRTPRSLERLRIRGHATVRGKMPPTLKHLNVNAEDTNELFYPLVTVTGIDGSLPESLEELLYPSLSSNPWVQPMLSHTANSFPNMKRMWLRPGFNAPIEHVLATMRSCTHLVIEGGAFNQPIAEGLRHMTRLETLRMETFYFSHSLPCPLPSSLKVLEFSTSEEFTHDLTGILPPELRVLDVRSTAVTSEILDPSLPSTLERLAFPRYYGHDPSRLLVASAFQHLHTLVLPGNYPGPLNLGNLKLPDTLIRLETGPTYAHCLADVVPPNLQVLILGSGYECDIRPLLTNLPRLKELTVNSHPRTEDWTEWPPEAFPATLEQLCLHKDNHIFIPWHRFPLLHNFVGPIWMIVAQGAWKDGLKMIDRLRKALEKDEAV